MRLLLVEDEKEMAGMIVAALGRHGMIVDHVPSLAQAEEAVTTTVHDAVLLDRQLPDGDGLSLIPLLRAKRAGVPVIVLSALGSTTDRIAGLDTGADDYLPKPFSVDELLARLRAVLRRPSEISSEVIRAGRLSFDVGERHALVGETVLDLPRRELLVLETLIRRAGRSVTRQAIEEAVFGFDDEIASNALDAYVSRLRRRLLDSDAGVEIHAIRGIGYLLKAAD
jgi:DNA-binding response OmpR family regulator